MRALQRYSLGIERSEKQARNRRITLAICISLGAHLAILDLILWPHPVRLAGYNSVSVTGGDVAGSYGMAPINIELMARQASAPSHPPKPVAKTEETAKAIASSESVSHSVTAATDAEPQDHASQDADPFTTEQHDQTTTQVAQGADGIPDGNQKLLDQIARCLPVDARPVLAGTKLDISLNDAGDLAAVPTLEMNLDSSSREQIAEANLIVQATLQCGPYQIGEKASRTFALMADFSKVSVNP